VNQEAASTDSLSRHCEHSEAIHSFFRWRDGFASLALAMTWQFGVWKMKWPLEIFQRPFPEKTIDW
jgi:hypothetical protein